MVPYFPAPGNQPKRVPSVRNPISVAVPPDGALRGPIGVTTAVSAFTRTRLSGRVGESSLVVPHS